MAAEVARALHAPLDVFLVRKLGVPGDEELAMGAIATGGVIVLNDGVVRDLRLPDETIATWPPASARSCAGASAAYRGGRPPADVAGRIVLLVDDGLATGSTMRAAVGAMRLRAAARVVVAVPVAAEETCRVLRAEADDLVCVLQPAGFRSVGGWYDDFSATGDDEVRALLAARE